MSRLVRDVEGGPLATQPSVVCIGAFDGLHVGHQALVRHTLARARSIGALAGVISFDPLPREFLLGAEAPPRVASARDRFERLRAMGVDLVGLLRFNARLASMSAEDFVTRVLVGRWQVAEVWVGEDFRFGHKRRGDLALLRQMGETLGFRAEAIETHEIDGQRVSSSAVRAALAVGDFDTVERALGRPYSISGKVIRGRQLGRELGYPTANQRLAGVRPALTGIFATRVHGVGERPWPAVSSLGTRPTVDGVEPLLETHLFDFDGDLYGRRIEVEFVARLRDELKFESLEALTEQMHRDAAQARAILAAQASLSNNVDRKSA
ncbi:bifunctional riboflavin kinase/FAD synthetase [Pseudomarimonas salicorniae]|uniref:Riboflavin biosynthesis protein n=1 Tax=Pseudomarimonas salicorniae TaxID=2933270 RepID=A0ABT0GF90_9GAMM|nr:bifunctional riboflavin kinase/FAD synthetase [Lysobacter sp. CAU 1642]MCK7593209.1 bifunctional riboflavin kinase/FAD synthetase [Lysobacter sp. CAU 1642]